MKSNYDRSKNIIRKTTENYHPRADDPLLLFAENRAWKPLPVYNCTLKICLPRRLVSNFSCLSLKIVKLAFPATDMLLRPWRRYLNISVIIASGRQVVKYQLKKITQKYWVFISFWPGHSDKNAFSKRANKRCIYYIAFFKSLFLSPPPGDHRKQKLQVHQLRAENLGLWLSRGEQSKHVTY